MASAADGWLDGHPDHGLFVHETRLLSHYSATINRNPPLPVAFSSISQHSSIGYYIVTPPGSAGHEIDGGSGLLQGATQQTLELQLVRHVADGVHEDLHLTNFTQSAATFQLALRFDADFADQAELNGKRQQRGTLTRKWIDVEPGRRKFLVSEGKNRFHND